MIWIHNDRKGTVVGEVTGRVVCYDGWIALGSSITRWVRNTGCTPVHNTRLLHLLHFYHASP